MTTLDRHGPGYRAAQMGRVTAALIGLAVVLLLAAAAALIIQGPGASGVAPTALLPVDVELRRPGHAVVLAVAALVAATLVAIAGLQTASAMHVLSRDRRTLLTVRDDAYAVLRRASDRLQGLAGCHG